MPLILIIDDDEEMLLLLNEILNKFNYDVIAISNGEDAINVIRSKSPDLVITDIMMPGITGGEIYREIRKEMGPEFPIIVSSATSIRMKTAPDPFLEYCPKPVDPATLIKSIEHLLLKNSQAQLKEEIDET
ncbi:MAG: Transcriptional regulatory protein AfsQ1 [candidate division BRC1 bacterium ADurb.Bin183]|jgi:CheY-like chemotaxis protein|nr:MAG: Transcriptional regulatory protein AfsQ1 [candidate division BRC1 bacterium ADurb.Bin183]